MCLNFEHVHPIEIYIFLNLISFLLYFIFILRINIFIVIILTFVLIDFNWMYVSCYLQFYSAAVGLMLSRVCAGGRGQVAHLLRGRGQRAAHRFLSGS